MDTFSSMSFTSGWLDTIKNEDVNFKHHVLSIIADECITDYTMKVVELDSDELVNTEGLESEHVKIGIEIVFN